METRTLHSGTNRLDVSALCLGVMFLGVKQDQQQSFAVLDRFYEAGGRYFDTSNNYGTWTEDTLGTRSGDSERMLGSWIASRRVADEVVVATKCGADKADPNRPLSIVPPTNYEGLSAEVVREQLTGSLQRLGLDRIGVYYGHVDDRTRDVTEIADVFSALAEEGLINIPGMSNTATWRLAIARAHSRQHDRPEFGAWQQEHSIYWPHPGTAVNTRVNRESIDYAATEPELTIMSFSPQQGGQLVRPWMPIAEPYRHPGSQQRLQLAHRIAHDLGGTANQVALAWHLRGVRDNNGYRAGSNISALADLPEQRAALVPIFGASSPAQVDEALGALDLKLTEDHLELLDTV